MKTTRKSRSVNIRRAALPLSVLDAPPRNTAGQCVPVAWRGERPADDDESWFLDAVSGYDANSVDDLRKIACLYADLRIVAYLDMAAGEIGDVAASALVRRAARGIGHRAGICPDEFLRVVLVLVFGVTPFELRDIMEACRQYGRIRSHDTVERIRGSLAALRGSSSGEVTLHALGLSSYSMRTSAKRAGVSAANISQRAARISERLKRRANS